jgi:hypothetical protein
MAALPELRGKQLLCFCAPQACHGHVLVKALEWHDRQANADPEEALDRAVEHERSVLNHCEDHVTDVALLLHDAC